MRGLVHIGDGKLELRDLPAVSAGERGAVLRVEGSAVCIGDAETLHGYGPVMATPLVLGHEIVGRVEGVGPTAPRVLQALRGARVLIDDARPCGKCDWCLRDQKRFCKSPRYGHIVQDASSSNWGGYAETVTLDGVPPYCASASWAPFRSSGGGADNLPRRLAAARGGTHACQAARHLPRPPAPP